MALNKVKFSKPTDNEINKILDNRQRADDMRKTLNE